MAVTHSTAARSAACNAVVDLLDAGSANTYPHLVFQTSGDVEVATLEFQGATAFGAATNGTATANTIADDTNATGGTVAKFECQNQDGNMVFEGNVTATGGGGDIELSSVTVQVGDTVSVSSMTYTAAS